MTDSKPNIAVIGCGRVGTALALHLERAGYAVVGLASRRLASAQAAAAFLRTPGRLSERPEQVTPRAQVVFITTPDGAIAQVCRETALSGGFAPGAVVLHCSGALSSMILAPARGAGAHIGSLHPLQSFAAPRADHDPFRGIIVSVEGDGPALERAEALSRDLGARCHRIRTAAKTLYHAAAVVASNYLVTLLDLSFALLGEAGVAPEQALDVLGPLIDGTLANVRRCGPAAALTGPVARGDRQTVGDHLAAIGGLDPASLPLYRALGRATVELARRGGHIDAAQAADLLRRLAAEPHE
jgi:predicted short-subunit dehydrogenase-like oxidoreductase (DUF2520 family)